MSRAIFDVLQHKNLFMGLLGRSFTTFKIIKFPLSSSPSLEGCFVFLSKTSKLFDNATLLTRLIENCAFL